MLEETDDVKKIIVMTLVSQLGSKARSELVKQCQVLLKQRLNTSLVILV